MVLALALLAVGERLTQILESYARQFAYASSAGFRSRNMYDPWLIYASWRPAIRTLGSGAGASWPRLHLVSKDSYPVTPPRRCHGCR